jgi:hypothetical protein
MPEPIASIATTRTTVDIDWSVLAELDIMTSAVEPIFATRSDPRSPHAAHSQSTGARNPGECRER